MRRRDQAVRWFFTIAAGVLVLGWMTTGTARAAGCDRACLQNLLTTYLDAMVSHAPSQLPLAANARFTENSNELKLGDGLWKTVTRKGDFRQDYIDRKRQIAAAHVVLYEGDTQILYSVVLHVAKRKISGIETLVYRVTADEKSKPDQLDKPILQFTYALRPRGLPRGEREPDRRSRVQQQYQLRPQDAEGAFASRDQA
jgi:hypothetical protein